MLHKKQNWLHDCERSQNTCKRLEGGCALDNPWKHNPGIVGKLTSSETIKDLLSSKMQALHTMQQSLPSLKPGCGQRCDFLFDEIGAQSFQVEEPEARWRVHGRAKRQALLDQDRKRGGTKFNLNSSCSVHRYFQVAHRVSELIGARLTMFCSMDSPSTNDRRLISFMRCTRMDLI